MKNIFFIALSLLMATSVYCDDSANNAKNTKELTQDTFFDFITKNDKVFVYFYAPWCGHCKSLAPIISKLSTRMQEAGGDIIVASVDADGNRELAEKYAIKSFPTLKYFVGGEPINYEGPRDEEELVKWVNSDKVKFSDIPLMNDVEELKKIDEKSLCVIFSSPQDDEKQMKIFKAFAANFDKVSIYFTSSDAVKQKYSVRTPYAMVLHRKFDDGLKVFGSEKLLNLDILTHFFEAHRYPFVTDIELETLQRIFSTQAPALFLLTENSEENFEKLFDELAQTYRGKLIFAKGKFSDPFAPQLIEILAINKDEKHHVRLLTFENSDFKKFKPKEITRESIEELIKDWGENKLKPLRKSQAIPKESDWTEGSGKVRILVGDSFDDAVLNNDQNVLVDFYAPWCQHCKELEPIYDELAKQLKGIDNLVIAKYDATANEHADVSVKQYPTIKLYKKGDKKNPIAYEREPSLPGLYEFLKNELTDSDFNETPFIQTTDL